MKKVLVKLSSVEMVKDFNSKLFPLEGEFDLGTGHYIGCKEYYGYLQPGFV